MAALACFNDKGIEATSIADIGQQAGASVGSMYHHYGNKEGIAIALLVEGMRSNAEMLKAHLENRSTARQAIEAAVMSLVEWIVTNPEWARFIYTVSSSRLMQQSATQLKEVNSHNSELLAEYLAKHSKQLRSVPKEVLPSLLLGSVHDYARRWLNGQVLTNPKELESFFIDAAWQNVKSH